MKMTSNEELATVCQSIRDRSEWQGRREWDHVRTNKRSCNNEQTQADGRTERQPGRQKDREEGGRKGKRERKKNKQINRILCIVP